MKFISNAFNMPKFAIEEWKNIGMRSGIANCFAPRQHGEWCGMNAQIVFAGAIIYD